MQIELPDEIIKRAKALADDGQDVAVVMSEALAKLEWERQEIAAVKEGIDAHKAGAYEPWEDFSARFKAERGIV